VSDIQRNATGMKPIGRLLRWKRVAEDLDVSTKTLERIAKRDPEFPDVTYVGPYKHVEEFAHEDYKRLLIARGRAER